MSDTEEVPAVDATQQEKQQETMELDETMDTSVESFEKQLQQQELELQQQLQQVEEAALEDRKAAILQQQDLELVAPVPAPVAAPEGWQQHQDNSTAAPATETATNGVTDNSNDNTSPASPPAVPTADSSADNPSPESPVKIGTKRSSSSAEPCENGKEDKEPLNKQRKLDEVSKLWTAVNDNPKDFQAWTNLLQHVDQQSDLEAGREAYTKFFDRYPYCYGYWKKFADLEKRKGTQQTTLQG